MEKPERPKCKILAFCDWFLKEAFSNEESKIYFWVNNIIVFFVFVSIGLIIAESMKGSVVDESGELFAKYEWIKWLETFIIGVFTFDYIANIYVSRPKRKYVLSFMGLVDLLAILPSYLSLGNLAALKVFRVTRVLRFLRLMRLLRILRLLKLTKGITKGIEKKDETSDIENLKMAVQIYLVALFSVVVTFSTIVYYAEQSNPETAFKNIPISMWWCIVTITTVGYGDMYPITPLGRIFAAGAMLCGLALFALLTNVIGKSMMTFLFGSADIENVTEEEIKAQLRKK